MKKNISDTAIFLTGDRKGSSSVFLMMIMASMAGLVISLIAVTNTVASAGAADSVFTLAGRSVLAEYDRDLKDDFGIFAFRGSPPEIEEKISFYAGHTLARHPSFRIKDVRADTCEYTLMNTEAFRREITGFAKYAAARGLADGTAGGEKGAGQEVSSGTGHQGSGGVPRDYVLRNSMQNLYKEIFVKYYISNDGNMLYQMDDLNCYAVMNGVSEYIEMDRKDFNIDVCREITQEKAEQIEKEWMPDIYP